MDEIPGAGDSPFDRRSADTPILRWLRRGAIALFFVGVLSCVVENADSPADPTLVDDTASSAPGGSLAERFGTILVGFITASGEVLEFCLLDADDAGERSRGLMEVTDLQGHDGMLFRFDDDVQASFVMIDTVMPLSISWWGADGTFVSGTDMDPCVDGDSSQCARYQASGPYRYAIEVPQGELAVAEPGATIEVRDGSSCQTP